MYFWYLITAMTISIILSFAVYKVALFFNITPKKDYRRLQKGKIALWGGLALYLTIVVGYLIWPQEALLNLILPASIIVVMGLLDDRFEMKAISKFTAQCVAALAWLYLNQGPNLLMQAEISPFLSLSLSALWIVGLCNAFNLIDGTDGQATVIGLLGFAFIGICFPTLMPMSVIFMGAGLGFLMWNFPPAKIYLGESGSTLLGFSMATMTLSLPIPKEGTAFSVILGALYLVAFPLTDTVLAMGRRKLKKRPLFCGDKDHIHHILQKMGFNKIQVLMIVSFMVLFGDLTAFNLFQATSWPSALILTLNSAALMIFVLFGLYYVKRVSAHKVSYFGRSLLEKYIISLNHDPADLNIKKAFLIDLLPYYAELQSRGITSIVNFVKEISALLAENKNYQLHSVGSYSVAVICKDGTSWTSFEVQEINQKVKDIFINFEVLRSLSETPEGIQYFDQNNIYELMELIPIYSEKLNKSILRAAG